MLSKVGSPLAVKDMSNMQRRIDCKPGLSLHARSPSYSTLTFDDIQTGLDAHLGRIAVTSRA